MSVAVIFLEGGLFSLAAQEPVGLESAAKAIIEKRCLACHNAQMKTSGLVLSSLENALKGGSKGAALVPRKPDESLIWQRIAAGQMPPANPLSGEEREVIRQWIESGAPWAGVIGKAARPRGGPDWWSLQPLKVSSPPDPEGISAEWSRGPIDRFIYAKLAEKKLQPSGPADRRTYIRRATFDLLGLPPTPEEVEAFVADKSAEAYEKLIDRLLASPHYGERWGRHWLDVIRFGESHGYEQNHLREHAWPFRDYVIRSFNDDKPFNRMIVEQLAGDQIAPGDPAVEVATGFLVAGIHDTVKIENIEGELVKRANDLDDFLSTAGAAFLGLTVNCARCHDHKFDPILQADYYRFQSIFAGVEHAERALATTAEIERHRAVAEPLRKQVKSIDERFAALKGQGEALAKQRREEIARKYKPPVDSRGTGEVFDPTQARFIRMTIEGSTKNSPPAIDELEVWTADPAPVNVALASNGTRAKARSTRSTMTATEAYHVENLTDGKFDKLWISGEDGKGQITLEFPRPQNVSRIFWSRDRLGGQQGRFLGQVATRYIFEASLDGIRWRKLTDSIDRLPYEEEAREEFFLLSVLSPEQKSEWTSLKERRAALEKQLAQIPAIPAAYIGRFVQPKEPTHLLKRGNPMDKGEVIAPASLSTLKSMLPGFELPPDAPEGQRRLALARWIADDSNALTARVIVNRIWHYHFGKGLVGTPSDFGFNGERPTHPELLDWMARRFIELGWRLKPFHRELMLSAAYRLASTANEKAAAVDSEARYLWHFPPKRLEAEAVRDSLLAVTGKLNPLIGGPGFRLYKYTVDNVATYLPLETSSPETFRRSVYHQAARSVRDDMLGTHDCPDSTIPEPKRVVTTTPLQALTLLNSSFILDQARYFAERLEREAGKNRAVQIERAFQLAFGRAPKAEEVSAAAALIGEHGLAVFCRALLNANEFVYVM